MLRSILFTIRVSTVCNRSSCPSPRFSLRGEEFESLFLKGERQSVFAKGIFCESKRLEQKGDELYGERCREYEVNVYKLAVHVDFLALSRFRDL